MPVESISLSKVSQPLATDQTVPHTPNLNAIAVALQTGDVFAAKSASAAIQGSPAGKNTLVAEDLLALENALKAKDIPAAQQALAELKHHFGSDPATDISGNHIDTKA